MHCRHVSWDRPYLRLLAGVFGLLCGISTVRCGWLTLSGTASVPLLPSVFCALLAAGGILYFIRPRAGHHLLLGTALLVLALHGAAGPAGANIFWLLTIGLLLIPCFLRGMPLSERRYRLD